MPRRSGGKRGTFYTPRPVIENMVRLLSETNMSGKELADRVGVSAQAVSQWINGQLAPTQDRIAQIAEALNVEVEELTRETPVTATVAIKRYDLDLAPTEPPAGRLLYRYTFTLPWDFAQAHCWSCPEETVAIQVKDNNLEPSVLAGELLFVDLSWRSITLSDLYLLNITSLPVFRWCYLVIPNSVNVSDRQIEQKVPINDLVVLGRVVGRFSGAPIRKLSGVVHSSS